MVEKTAGSKAVEPVVTHTRVVDQPPVRSNVVWRIVGIGGRLFTMATGLALQALVIYGGLTWATSVATWVRVASVMVSLLVLLYIMHDRRPMDYKLIWTILILALPVFGGVVFLVYGNRPGSRQVLDRKEQIREHTLAAVKDIPGVIDEATIAEYPNPRVGQQVTYLSKVGPFVPYGDTKTTYYALGEDAFVDMLKAMESAEEYILAEYFIVSEGHMFDAAFEVMTRKASEGVNVMFMYDDLGSMWNLPVGLVKRARAAGIKIKAVNRFLPGSARFNNRDHRKMLVVDGKMGFTGGINLGDEYINIIDRFGHWKDTVLGLEGPAVWGLVGLFFSLWDQTTGQRTEFAHLRPNWPDRQEPGIVVCYDDSPFDDTSVGWAAYRNQMSRARHSVDIMTPYLIPSRNMLEDIADIARSGVRVRIITPGVPDKKLVFEVTRSNYQVLIEGGVEIYEYLPGFMHAKQMIVDDDFAIIGTINFDFRSFYLHQENAVWMYNTTAIADMIRDFDHVVTQCRRVTLEETQQVSAPRRLLRSVLRTFAPML